MLSLAVYSGGIDQTFYDRVGSLDGADIFNGLMALPNLIALVALSGVVAAETKQYFAKQKNFFDGFAKGRK